MRRQIGSTIEAPALYLEYSAYRNLELQRILIGNPDREICGKLLEMVGLAEVKDKKALYRHEAETQHRNGSCRQAETAY